MVFHENRLLADDSNVISYLIFVKKIGKDVAKFVVCCSCDWPFRVYLISKASLRANNEDSDQTPLSLVDADFGH